MPIKLLDSHTADLIAAGEVVERPASVVKELVENSVDAGASSISVSILRGGVQSIKIEDNGGGVLGEEIPLAFVRHATSKISEPSDLHSIHTLGFRGEALASVASVARVWMLSKTDSEEDAHLYSIEGGKGGAVEPAARARGTTICVEDLFYNTPARMKFLKKDSSEGAYVTEALTRLALSCPQVALSYTREGKSVFATPGAGDVLSAAYAVLGREFAGGLLPIVQEEISQESGIYKVSGLITPPSGARASRSMQFFFINGRYVKNQTMMAALEQAYRGRTMSGKFPGGIIFLTMPHELVDVNVHPAKTQVRFAKEQEVFGAVYRAVKLALAQSDAQHPSFVFSEGQSGETANTPQSDASFETAEKQGERPQDSTASQKALQDINALHYSQSGEADMLQSSASATPYTRSNPFLGGGLSQSVMYTKPVSAEDTAARGEWGLDIEMSDEEEHKATPVPQQSEPAENTAEQQVLKGVSEQYERTLHLVGEVFGTYIVAQKGEQMVLIDKHAAHERVLYEKISASHERGHSQQLLVPLSVPLSAAEKQALLQNSELLQGIGLEVEDFGGGEVLVRGVPAETQTEDVHSLVGDIAARMAVNPKDNIDAKTQWVLHSMACRAAVKANDRTPTQQLVKLAEDILSGELPPFCPHGRPVVLMMSRKELEKQFGRQG